MDWHKVNKRLALGLTGEQEEKITDFFRRISRWKIKVLAGEKIFCEDMGVDPRLAAIVKSGNDARIRLLPGGGDYDVDFDRPPDLEGICSFWADKNGNADEEINRIIYRNKLRYRDSGYNLFHFDTG
ncbi:MAG: hypothetical protein LBU98_02020, partial [Alistipes sp.]|nr:hypothetical protein [Alistipes sp.]